MILLPLIGLIINAVITPLIFRGVHNHLHKTKVIFAGSVATLVIFISFLLSCYAYFILSSNSSAIKSPSYLWPNIDTLKISFQLVIDKLSIILCLVVTAVGSLIHLYSIGYMGKDDGVVRYFVFLNLFCFSMLLLIIGNSLPLMFFGWEGVGLCSYLLIGFWYTDKEKLQNATKAFIMNRIGDIGLLLAMVLIFKSIGTLEISNINQIISTYQSTYQNTYQNIQQITQQTLDSQTITIICLLLFVGAIGKSAQIPLYTWLPDAMSGPTPVSALIHAATMVTAGVYMIVRFSPLYQASPTAMAVIATIGAGTALFAATIAIAQNDIKKVLAYSTISQLGFMFLACGVGAYTAAIFHLLTHAFFKALLFLGAGSVIHACQGEQDMQKFGGLRKYLPHTFVTMMIGSFAISGLPLFSGFFSKDEILFSVLALPYGGSGLYLIATITAFLTAIYTARLISMTFLGEERFTVMVRKYLHESPSVMLVPLYVLAFLATIGGIFGLHHFLVPNNYSEIVIFSKLPEIGIHLPLTEREVMISSAFISIVGFILGLTLFRTKTKESKSIRKIFKIPLSIQRVLENKYYVDEIYDYILVRPLRLFAYHCSIFVEQYVFDLVIVLLQRVIFSLGKKLRTLQSGDVQMYLLFFLLGITSFLFLALNFKG
ncbi:MAG: NADH-quinone oxidoreductase subunit L [Oligoflexia bacterium]|nr:NADH-quinone oxidoreductase subunit L [Oligoflexia bacterium]